MDVKVSAWVRFGRFQVLSTQTYLPSPFFPSQHSLQPMFSPLEKPGTPEAQHYPEKPPLIHECSFTLILSPTPTQETTQESLFSDLTSSGSNAEVQDFTKNVLLTDALANDSDALLMALSRDGKAIYCNDLCREVISYGLPLDQPIHFDFPWLEGRLQVWDSNFTRKLPLEQWPIYRAAVGGETIEGCIIGMVDEMNKTNPKRILEIDGKALVCSDSAFSTGSTLSFLPIDDFLLPNYRCSEE